MKSQRAWIFPIPFSAKLTLMSMNERRDMGRFGRVRGLSVAGIEPCGGWYVDGDCALALTGK